MDISDRKIITYNSRKSANISEFLIYAYFALTFFEPFLNGVFGSILKYYILFLVFVLFCKKSDKIFLRSYIFCYIDWLGYRFLTLIWTENLWMFNQHVLSQIGMVLLLVAITSRSFDKRVINNIVRVMLLSSFVIAILTLMFAQSYRGIAETRQVLVLFGQETDPNNQAAFLLVGISIAVYYLIYEKKSAILSFAVLFVNSIAMFRTGSRGGFVSMIAIVLFVTVFNKKNSSIAEGIKKFLILTAVFMTFYFVLKNYVPQNILDRLLNANGYEGGSERTIIWRNGLKLLKEDMNFFFGAGWGDYFGYNGFYVAMHNTYLAMLCDVGIVGFILFFMPILKKVFYCMKNREYLPIMLLIAGFMPCFFLDAINKRFFWNAIMFLFMFIVSHNREEKEKSYEANSYNQSIILSD